MQMERTRCQTQPGRRLAVVAQGLPLRAGAQLAVDVTLHSAVAANGSANSRASDVDGTFAEGARRDKEEAYPEQFEGRRCGVVVFSVEADGRWSKEAADFVEQLSLAKARGAPPRLGTVAALQWQRRWVKVGLVVCSHAFASSLVAPTSASVADPRDGEAPSLSD